MKTYMFEVSHRLVFIFVFQNVSNGINYSTMREISLLRQLVYYPQFVRLLDILEEEAPG